MTSVQFHLIFVRIEVVYGVFCSVERLDLQHFELYRKGEVQHLGGEWRLGLLHQGIHGDWRSAFYRYLHVVDFLLNVPEPLLPQPLLVSFLSGGLVRIMLPGVASFPFSIRFSTRVEVLFFSGNRVLVFSGLSCHICLMSCSNSFSKCWLVTRSASTSSVLARIVSNTPSGGRLSTSPGWSYILGGLALFLLVFRVDTISR